MKVYLLSFILCNFYCYFLNIPVLIILMSLSVDCSIWKSVFSFYFIYVHYDKMPNLKFIFLVILSLHLTSVIWCIHFVTIASF